MASVEKNYGTTAVLSRFGSQWRHANDPARLRGHGQQLQASGLQDMNHLTNPTSNK
jgi:hypothetical protein